MIVRFRWSQLPSLRFCLVLCVALGLAAAAAHADAPAPFDLGGPDIEVKVIRGGQSLPISQVPNLSVGDQLWLKADLPLTQSEHYLMVVAFLRGATNPPPAKWFFGCETWTRTCAQEGLSVTVPSGAQQVLVFLAPETGGDFKTLVNAVRGRPGAFVRASQDLNQASLDRSRLEDYLSAIRTLDASDPDRLKLAAPMLARSLAIKVDDKCLDKIPELQAPCLMQGGNTLILNDGHSTSIVEALTSGPASDLAMEASFTPQLSYGYYSPYVASVLDIARIMSSFHTAQYQYIPALAFQHDDRLTLTLNTAPSFHDPKSVLAAALPAVEQEQLPPLHAVDPKQIYCARKTALVLPVEGAPLVFSTGYAHDMTLSLTGADHRTIELPAKADAEQGGFVIDTTALSSVTPGDSIQGSLQGYWGFDRYAGPNFQLVNEHAQDWTVAAADAGTVIVGRENTIHLQANNVSCIDAVMLKDPSGKELKTEWKAVKPDEVELKLPLEQAAPGELTLLVKQYGTTQPQPLQLQAFSEAGHLDSFTLHAGDTQGVLLGSRLDKVAELRIKGIEFLPSTLTVGQGHDQLILVAQDTIALATLKPTDTADARVVLKDGRGYNVGTIITAPRPHVILLGKSVQLSPSGDDSNIQLANQDELPQNATLTFSVRAQSPSTFSYDEKLEVATTDGSSSVLLSAGDGSITLEDASVAVATLDPAKAFGPSAFGPLQLRAIVAGTASDWQPLATLVRLPALKELKCPASPELACKLSGSNLFLVDAVSDNLQFDHPVQVPEGFPGYALPVPRPTAGPLYVKLRDDPSVINATTLAAQQLPPTAEEAEHAAARHAAASGSGMSSPLPSLLVTPSRPEQPVPPPPIQSNAAIPSQTATVAPDATKP